MTRLGGLAIGLALLLAGCSASDSPGPVPGGNAALTIAGGGDNVLDRCSSDLWVHGTWAYTGTYGCSPIRPASGNVVNIWDVGVVGAPVLTDSVVIPSVRTVSDLQVSDDGALLVVSTEGSGANPGLYLYSLADPRRPSLVGQALVGSRGIHTVTVADIAGRRYAFAALNPRPNITVPDDEPALVIYDITDPAAITTASRTNVPANYGLHDTFVRDGYAFAFVWNDGVFVYDVGNGARGGTPQAPVEVSRVVTGEGPVPGHPSAHNGWWFHNPVAGERRYLFVGQEGPGNVGQRSSSGDIHVLDVSDLSAPREVAFYHRDDAGAHNFWMDEARQILYAAYYNGGVVALDVSGTLAGDLAGRQIAEIRPGGGNTFVWGVQLAGGSLYAIDMLTGFWKLGLGGRLAE